MKYAFHKNIVLGLGGSIMFPDEIDVDFLKKLKGLIGSQVKKGRKFVIVAGGGRIARKYQEAAGGIGKVTDEDKDWLGIHATRGNAHLLRTIFRNLADPVVLDERHKIKILRHPITIASGWRPGWSTDYVAVALAFDFNVSEVVVWGKPTHVFEKDPAKFPEAKSFSEISWHDYRKLIPSEWKPGAHAPVDPVAARLAEKDGVKCIVIGKDFENCRNLLNGKSFQGTVVS